jgi:hypothetical protein
VQEREREREREQERERQQVQEMGQPAAVAEGVAVASANLCKADVDRPADTAPESTQEVVQHRVTWLEYPCRVSLYTAS